MRLFFSLALLGLFTSFSAQEVIYPYNPDANNDQYVAVSDVLSTISAFGSEFLPTEIQIDGVGLAEVIGQLQASISALETENLAQAVLITELQNSSGGGIEGLDTYLSVDESTNTVLISGANLQVVSGAGSTDAAVNGTGNIIIGYDEDIGDDKSGSHNLVVGVYHTYSSYGGIVVGFNNSIIGDYSSVSGGKQSAAEGSYSSVSGGSNSIASGENSSVSGGIGNIALGSSSSVSGGSNSTALGDLSSVSGGLQNSASGLGSSVSGGRVNEALGSYSSVSGGYGNSASGSYSSVLGGRVNEALGSYSSVSGGGYNTALEIYHSVSGNAGYTFLDNSADGNTID